MASSVNFVFCQVFMMHHVTKATPIYFINGKCHIKKLKVTNHTGFMSCHWLLMSLGVNMDTDTDTDTH